MLISSNGIRLKLIKGKIEPKKSDTLAGYESEIQNICVIIERLSINPSSWFRIAFRIKLKAIVTPKAACPAVATPDKSIESSEVVNYFGKGTWIVRLDNVATSYWLLNKLGSLIVTDKVSLLFAFVEISSGYLNLTLS